MYRRRPLEGVVTSGAFRPTHEQASGLDAQEMHSQGAGADRVEDNPSEAVLGSGTRGRSYKSSEALAAAFSVGSACGRHTLTHLLLT